MQSVPRVSAASLKRSLCSGAVKSSKKRICSSSHRVSSDSRPSSSCGSMSAPYAASGESGCEAGSSSAISSSHPSATPSSSASEASASNVVIAKCICTPGALPDNSVSRADLAVHATSPPTPRGVRAVAAPLPPASRSTATSSRSRGGTAARGGDLSSGPGATASCSAVSPFATPRLQLRSCRTCTAAGSALINALTRASLAVRAVRPSGSTSPVSSSTTQLVSRRHAAWSGSCPRYFQRYHWG
mmetsp:Transcript_8602/g.22207  ORF Transcript_8602/g.22207 Transcript_8602/m.22207 type:complete len:244 (-) Transcript_8602:659-1390(-)